MNEDQKNALINEILELEDYLENIIFWEASEKLLEVVSLSDIYQEVFVRILQRLNYIYNTPEIPLKIKLRKIAIQTIRDLERYYFAKKRPNRRFLHIKVKDSQTTFINLVPGSFTSPTERVIRNERCNSLHQALNALNQSEKRIIVMHFFEDLNFDECAVILKIKPNAAKERFYRALKKLKEIVKSLSIFDNYYCR